MAWTAEQRAAAGARMKAGREKKRQTREAATPGQEGGGRVQPVSHGGPPPAVSAASVILSRDALNVLREEVEIYHAAGLGKGKMKELMLGLGLRGAELGIPVGQAIENLYIGPKGELAQQAELMRALVYRSGGRLPIVEADDTHCEIRPERDGRAYKSVVFTIEQAKRQGLLDPRSPQAASWETMPRQMLFARATSEAARQVFSDLLMGVSYTPEELGAVVTGGEQGERPSRSAPAGPAPTQHVRKTLAEPVKMPVERARKPQEAPAVAETPGGTPTPPSVSPVAREAVEPPPNGGKHPERALSVEVELPMPGDPENTQKVKTAGITAPQILMLQAMTAKNGGYPDWQEKQARGRSYFAKWGLKVDLKFLTKEEADTLIADLSVTPGEAETAARLVTALPSAAVQGPAEKLLNAVIVKLGLEQYRAEIVQAALGRFQVLTLAEMTLDQGKILASQVEAMAVDRETFPLLLHALRQQDGMP